MVTNKISDDTPEIIQHQHIEEEMEKSFMKEHMGYEYPDMSEVMFYTGRKAKELNQCTVKFRSLPSIGYA